MSLSRLFRPNNDRSILRNLVADREGWEKIAQKPYTEVKKTKLVDLNQQIDSFAAKWAFKGLGVFWHPQFIQDLLTLKKNESTQSSGQKVFASIWLHPLLLSLRVAKYCPAIGYGGSDMTIMSKAIVAVKDKIVINRENRNLEVIDDSFHQPDDSDDHHEVKEDEEIDETDNLNDLIEELVVTEEVGMHRTAALDCSGRSVSSLGRQMAFDEGKGKPEDEPEDEPEETVASKIETKIEKSTIDSFDIRSLLCGYHHEDENVKTEIDQKPTIIGYFPPKSLPMENPPPQFASLPQPQPPQTLGKLFADKNDGNITLQPIAHKIERSDVRESAVENDEFSEDLSQEYLDFLARSFSPSDHSVEPVNDVVNAESARVPDAPKADRTKDDQDADITLPADLFNTSANDDGGLPPMVETTLRQQIEEARPYHEAAEACYDASTPIGKHIRSFRNRYPPKPE